MNSDTKDSSIPKLKLYAVTYQRTKILVPCEKNPRTGKCNGCGRRTGKDNIKTTQLHHWVYAYETKTVKKNPILALENTNEFCFYPCHKAADALRSLAELNPKYHDTVITVGKCMPEWMRERFTLLCELWLKSNGAKLKK